MNHPKTAIGVAIVGAFALGAVAVSYSTARQDADDSKTGLAASSTDVSTLFSEAEESEIGEIVRAYLMDNPEVIIDAVNAYSEKQRVAAA